MDDESLPGDAEESTVEEDATPSLEPAPERTFETLMAEIEGNEDWKSAHEGHYADRLAYDRQQWVEIVKPQLASVESQHKERVKALSEAQQALSTLSGRLREAQKAGTLDNDTWQELMESHPKIAEGLTALGEEKISQAIEEKWQKQSEQERSQGAVTGAQWVLATGLKAIGREAVWRKHSPKINDAMSRGWEATGVAVKDALQEVVDAAYKAGAADAMKSKTEVAKVKARETQGPDVGASKGRTAPVEVKTAADFEKKYGFSLTG